VEVRDHLQTVRRFPAFEDKGQSRAFGAKIEKLVSFRRSGKSLDEDLIEWLKLQPAKLLRRLNDIGVIDGRLIGAMKPLADHVRDYELSLKAKGDTPQQIRQVMARLRCVLKDGRCQRWSDLTATKVEKALVKLQAECGVSKRTAHGYLQAVRQFAHWMIKSKRATELPVQDVKIRVKDIDVRRRRRALTIEEVVRLLVATRNSTRPAKMCGLARSLVYRLAIESGMRRGDFKHLRVGSLDFEQRTVSVVQGSKNGKVKVLPLRADTSLELQQYMASKLRSTCPTGLPT